MRLSSNQCEPVTLDGVVVGVNLGFDFCAEHEWGFKWAARHLGRPGSATQNLTGIAVRTTTKHDHEFKIELLETDDRLWLRGSAYWRDEPSLAADLADAKRRPMYLGDILNRLKWTGPPKRDLIAAWDGDNGFCVVALTVDGRAAVRIAHEALIADRCFINQGAGLLGRGGLCLIDAALIPEHFDAEMRGGDISALSLEDAVAATGIRERLKAAGCGYFALSPRWKDEASGTFIFWLNPTEQHRNNYGWYSLADLEAWADGAGPIPMTRKQQRERAP